MLRRHKDNAWGANEIGSIIISPTRELALQISEVLACFLKHAELSFLKQHLTVGGASIEEDINVIQKGNPSILVSTPGRLEDLFQRKGSLNLAARVKALVI